VLIQFIDVVINVMRYSGLVVGDDVKSVYIFGVNSSDVKSWKYQRLAPSKQSLTNYPTCATKVRKKTCMLLCHVKWKLKMITWKIYNLKTWSTNLWSDFKNELDTYYDEIFIFKSLTVPEEYMLAFFPYLFAFDLHKFMRQSNIQLIMGAFV
jgi:hypothetical protein